MAHPDLETEPHIRVAISIYDAFARTRIPGEARQVLDFILRKTYGWQKKEDGISLSQFAAGTGISRPHVCMAIRLLLQMNLIQRGSPEYGTGVVPKKVRDCTTYCFQKDFEKWRPLPKKVTLPKKVRDSPEKGKGVVLNTGHTISTPTILTSTIDITASPSGSDGDDGSKPEKKRAGKEKAPLPEGYHEFVKFWHETWFAKAKAKYHFQAEDFEKIKRLTKAFPLEKLKEAVHKHLGDKWSNENKCLRLRFFDSKINEYVAALVPKQKESTGWDVHNAPE